MIPDETRVDAFTEWAHQAEPRLRHALTALLGVDAGREATVDALTWAWERWAQVSAKPNPVGYVYGVGRNLGRRRTGRRRPLFIAVPEQRLPWVEPGLPDALAALSERQRVVVSLLHGYEWTMSEVAEVLGLSKSSVQNHSERGMAALRKELGVRS